MNQAEQDRRIDYVEFPTIDMAETKAFYTKVFGWKFTDYGPEYMSFNDGRLSGGFRLVSQVKSGDPLVVLYACELNSIEETVEDNGGKIIRETFEFPGGRRFHFQDPSGNQLAVWSDR